MKTRIKIVERNSGEKTYIPQTIYKSIYRGAMDRIDSYDTWYFIRILFTIASPIVAILAAIADRENVYKKRWVNLYENYSVIIISLDDDIEYGSITESQMIIDKYLTNEEKREVEELQKKKNEYLKKIKKTTYLKYP